MRTVTTDLLIIGGGIAGLWLLNRAQQQGYSALLLESGDLGGGQSVRSQGIIHGGTKYALNGALTQASNSIAGMPDRWRTCLKGAGELDLRQARILSDAHYMWSKGSIGSKMTTFFASKALKGRVDSVNEADRPDTFRNPAFRGALYRLNELVLDVPSVIRTLAEPVQQRIIKTTAAEFICDDNRISAVECGDVSLRIEAQRYITTAGEGTESLLQQLQQERLAAQLPDMQRRPLHMVMVRHRSDLPTYAHCISTGSKPVVTITTHPTADGEQVWYLGGDLAEAGIDRSQDEQIQEARKTLHKLLPWIELDQPRWATFHVNRAEPKQSSLTRPDSAFAASAANLIISWPTKLALAPDLADQVLALLGEQSVQPGPDTTAERPENLPHPTIAEPLWETLF